MLLGERVGVIRWVTVLVGFAGVMMVTGLGTDTFRRDAVLPVGAAALYAISGVTARLMDADVPSAVVNMYSTVFTVLGFLAIAWCLTGFPLFKAEPIFCGLSQWGPAAAPLLYSLSCRFE